MKKHIQIIIIFIIFFIMFSLLINFNNNIQNEKINISVYFCPRDYCKDILINQIKKANEIKCAFYELNLIDVIKEFKKKNSEIIIEDSTFEKNKELYFNDFNEFKELNKTIIKNTIIKDSNKIETNFSFLTSYSKALMHNKFCIFDRKIVFTGSMNPTFNDNYLNFNNILIIESEKISELFLQEFSELKNNIYGKGKKSKNNIFIKNNIESNIQENIQENKKEDELKRIEIYFCPEDNCQSQVLKEIEKANNSIYFMTFSFTDFEIGEKILAQKNKKNIEIKGIYDSSQLGNFSTYKLLKNFSIIDKSNYKLHNKVFIIDNKTILTGSYNPSKNANLYNDENLIIIENKEIAKKYINEFFFIYNLKNLSEQVEKFNFSNVKNKNFSDLFIYSVFPNPNGKDEKKDYFLIYNPHNKTIDLSYYKIYYEKKLTNLKENILPFEKKIIYHSLKNKNSSLYLIKNFEIIDYFFWNNSKEGELIFYR
ncbi:MAG: phospholipase D-like domain-containing protein [Candidatus Woesearchaeota archaeon]